MGRSFATSQQYLNSLARLQCREDQLRSSYNFRWHHQTTTECQLQTCNRTLHKYTSYLDTRTHSVTGLTPRWLSKQLQWLTFQSLAISTGSQYRNISP
uniref:Uncharacterized protein n=1 Tax=Arion vulgaris TaxID=1028688 RepID=A0A0B7B7C6_9EUPU